MDLIDRLADAIESHFKYPTGTISIDLLREGDEAIALLSPASNPSEFYLDRTMQNETVISIMVKSKSQQNAKSKCQSIADFVTGLTELVSLNNSFKFIGASIYTNVSFIDKTEKDTFIYAGLVQVMTSTR